MIMPVHMRRYYALLFYAKRNNTYMYTQATRERSCFRYCVAELEEMREAHLQQLQRS